MAAVRNNPQNANSARNQNAVQFLDNILQGINEEKKIAQIGDLDSQKEVIYAEAFKGNHLPLMANSVAQAQSDILTVLIGEFFQTLQNLRFSGKVGISWNDYLRPQLVCLIPLNDWDEECKVYEAESVVNAKLSSFGMQLDVIALEAPAEANVPEEFTEVKY